MLMDSAGARRKNKTKKLDGRERQPAGLLLLFSFSLMSTSL